MYNIILLVGEERRGGGYFPVFYLTKIVPDYPPVYPQFCGIIQYPQPALVSAPLYQQRSLKIDLQSVSQSVSDGLPVAESEWGVES